MPNSPTFPQWTLKTLPQTVMPISEQHRIAERLEVSPLLVHLMLLREISTEKEMDSYLSPGLRHLQPLDKWPGVEDGARVIKNALERGQQVAVWGDYDVDGITATALVKDFFQRRGFPALHFIPDRLDFGYGLNSAGIQKLAAEGVTVLLTVDCGIANLPEIAEAKTLGMHIIITDHHLPGQELPAADVILNPKLGGWPSPELSGVGVAFLLMGALNRMLPGEPLDIRQYLDLVALGTIADVVPLDEQNRILVKNGLLLIKEGRRPGIQALKDVSGLERGESIGAGAIGFALAPRINAAGRIGDPNLAVQLLLEENPFEARSIAAYLDKLNTKRKAEEGRILEEAIAQAEALGNAPGLVLFSEHWHSGIIGIVASRIVERFHRPCIILTKENGIFKGSGRSVPAFDLYKGLTACKQCLYKFGGHRQAAGLKLEPFQLGNLRELFSKAVMEQLGDTPQQPVMNLDALLPFDQISHTFLKELELLQPFGQGNPRPLFLSQQLSVVKYRFFGQNKHLEMHLADTAVGAIMRGVLWRQGERWVDHIHSGAVLTIAYTPRFARFNGLIQIELAITEILSLQ